MWKQQDSLEGPTATAAEMPASPEAGGGSEENSKDSNPLLERLRALEVKWIARSTSYPSPNCSPFPHHSSCSPCPFLSSLKCQIDRYIESTTFYLIKGISLGTWNKRAARRQHTLQKSAAEPCTLASHCYFCGLRLG